MVSYRTLNDLSQTIIKNIHKIPRDIDLVVAIPRSGLLPATMISEYLNIPLMTIEEYINEGWEEVNGGRRCPNKKKKRYKKSINS